jgi:hypothetical protein
LSHKKEDVGVLRIFGLDYGQVAREWCREGEWIV